jgi:trimeric autotransporter adhesin
MKRAQLFCYILCTGLAPATLFSQNIGVGTNAPHSSSQVDITSTNRGLLMPRMGTTSLNAIANPAKGLMVYDSAMNQLMVNMGNNTTPNWQTIVARSGWGLKGNTGTNPATDFIGTIDAQPLRFRVGNILSGYIDGTSRNVLFGPGIPSSLLYTENTSLGYNTFRNSAEMAYSIAIGAYAMENASGVLNTAVGHGSMRYAANGGGNTTIGASSLQNNTTGAENVASGLQALTGNTTGSYNVASGTYSMQVNQNGSYNTSLGAHALEVNRRSYNTAVGASALTGTDYSEYNVAVGYHAGYNWNNGFNNVFVGANTDVNGEAYYNVICVGQGTVAGAPSHARFGNPATVHYGGWANWSNLSDGRFKKNIHENVPGLAFISKLRPVTYNLEATAADAFLHQYDKREMSAEGTAVHQKALREKEQIIYTGFIAQEVESAARQVGFTFSGVEAPKNDNDTYSLRYAEFVVPLVKGMQEQQEMIVELKKQNEELKKRVAVLESRIVTKDERIKR